MLRKPSLILGLFLSVLLFPCPAPAVSASAELPGKWQRRTPLPWERS
jgi:hypothetical protein